MSKEEQDEAAATGIPAPEGASGLIDTDYVIGQDNISGNKFGVDVDLHGKVFTVSGLIILAFVIITLAFQNEVGPLFEGTREWLTSNLA